MHTQDEVKIFKKIRNHWDRGEEEKTTLNFCSSLGIFGNNSLRSTSSAYWRALLVQARFSWWSPVAPACLIEHKAPQVFRRSSHLPSADLLEDNGVTLQPGAENRGQTAWKEKGPGWRRELSIRPFQGEGWVWSTFQFQNIRDNTCKHKNTFIALCMCVHTIKL